MSWDTALSELRRGYAPVQTWDGQPSRLYVRYAAQLYIEQVERKWVVGIITDARRQLDFRVPPFADEAQAEGFAAACQEVIEGFCQHLHARGWW